MKALTEFNQVSSEDLIHDLMMRGRYGKTLINSGTAYMDTFYPDSKHADDYAPAVDYLQMQLNISGCDEVDKEGESLIIDKTRKLLVQGGYPNNVMVRVNLKLVVNANV